MSNQQNSVAPEESRFDARQKMAGLDVIASIVLFVLGGGVAYVSWTMKIFNRSRIVSPGLFPLILGFLFMFLGLLLGTLALRRNGLVGAAFLLGAENLKKSLSSPRFYRGGIIFLAILAYALLFGRIHFVAITAAYLFFNFAYLKALKLPVAVILSVAASFVIYAVFRYVFGIPVP